MAFRTSRPGVATGVAWTETGGDVLYIEATLMQGGSQNIIFVASGYLAQRELYRLGFLTTLFFLAVFLLVGTPWVLFVTR